MTSITTKHTNDSLTIIDNFLSSAMGEGEAHIFRERCEYEGVDYWQYLTYFTKEWIKEPIPVIILRAFVWERTPEGVCFWKNIKNKVVGVMQDMEVYHVEDLLAKKSKQEYTKQEYTELVESNNKGGSTDYYVLPPGCIDLQDLIEYRCMNFARANMFKALYRLGECSHSDAERDLNKVIWFANRELNRLRGIQL